MFIEHKMYRAGVLFDGDSGLGHERADRGAWSLGPKRRSSLVDLGHHAPNVNIEMIVARLIHVRASSRGFHFNDSKYGDDDLDTGAIDPFRLFLVFNELVVAEARPDMDLAHMLDQSHNVTDPIESLMLSAAETQRAYAQALIVDRTALTAAQMENDALTSTTVLKRAFRTDVEPILAMARRDQGGAVDPIAVFRSSGYRARVAQERPAVTSAGGGIV